MLLERKTLSGRQARRISFDAERAALRDGALMSAWYDAKAKAWHDCAA